MLDKPKPYGIRIHGMQLCTPCRMASQAGDHMSREQERQRIIESYSVFDISPDIQQLINEALESEEWDWYEDCDGCTAVSEIYWPTKYFPPCLRHDFDWITGNGGWAASRRFYALQRAYGVPIWRSALRSGAVTVVWYAWEKWSQKIFKSRT